ncbi:MAG: patatin-like phospholipase family protein [Candidatus Peribacteraceae bacterium]|nr:patatin-like phospholipase family protein [Candidatus Peribacteraceae bacterium]
MAKNIAVVLSGGGAKGGFQVGALDYIKKYHPEIWDNIQIVAGVSVGSLNATLLASGDEGWKKLQHLWLTIRKKDIMDGDTKWYNMLYRLLRKRKSIYNNNPLKKLINRIIDVDKIEKLLLVGVVDLVDGEYHKFNKHVPNFKKKLLASTAIPVVFPPVYDDNSCYVDGGVRNVSPFSDVLGFNPDKIIVINCSDPDMGKHRKMPKHVGDVAIASLDIMMNEVFRSDLALVDSCGIETIVIEPTDNLGETLDFDRKILDKRIAHGWQRAKEILE